MRIVCQKCSAAYAIDDKLVTPKGVRAQCPRCRNLQLVKREPVAEAAPPPPPPPAPVAPAPASSSPFLFDLGGDPSALTTPAAPGPNYAPSMPVRPPVAPASASASAPAPFAFDFSAPPPPAAAPMQSIAAPPPPAPMQANPFDFGSLPAAGASGAAFDFDVPPAAAPAPSARPSQPPPAASVKLAGPPAAEPDGLFDFGNAAAAESVTSTGSEVRCKSCGKVLTDPFDQALGTCDDCRSKQQEQPLDSYGAEPNSRIEHIDTSMLAARMAGPPPRGQTFVAVTTSSIPPGGGSPPAELSSVRSAMRGGESESSGRGRTIGIALAVVAVLGVGGYFVVQKKPWEKKRPPPIVRAAPTNSKPTDAVIQTWRMSYPELDGASPKQAAGFVQSGEESLAQDTPKSYREAEEAFQKALVVDGLNERAVAGYVFALAFGRGGQIDDQTAAAAESMLVGAEQRTGDPRLYVAHAHFLIARKGNVDAVQETAERGKGSTSASDKALASLAIGQAMLGKNETIASAAFAEALKLDPKLKRGYFFQARLAASMGRYKDAATNLEKRLALDADQWEAADELARLSVEVGEVPKAKKVLESALKAAPRNAKARIALAKLAYQHAGDPNGAIDALTAVTNDKDVVPADQSDAFAHLSAAYRMAGDPGKAADAAEKAVELSADSVTAKLQRFLSMADKNVTSQARIDLDSIKGKLNDAQLDNVLEGRLLMAQGRFDEAAAILAKVHEAEPRRAEALLLAGAAAARAKRDGQAWGHCLNKGLKLDPLTYAVPAMTQLYVRPADILRPAVGAYASLNPSGAEDPNPELCEGLVGWFSEDYGSADRHFAKVITIDQKNADSYAYRAMVALKRKDVGSAVRFGAKAVDAVRTNAIAHYALAAALMATNKPEAAKPEAVTANKLGPSLLAPRVIMADVEARLKNADEARRLLTTVLLSDSYYREAKRVLYKQSL